MRRFILLAAVGVFLFRVCDVFGEEDRARSIQIKGSDTMVNLGQMWAESFSQSHPDISVAVTGGGSGTGFSALIGGTCDIAQASRTIKPKETAQAQKNGFTPQEMTVALDGLVVVVHPDNPVRQLTLDQVADIFIGRITNWSQVGGMNRPIVILSREVNSGTHIYFKEHVLRKGNEKSDEEFSPAALLMPSSYAIAEEVAQNINAIGYYGIGYISSSQRALAIARDETSAYVAPTSENVKNGSYAISRPLLMYTRGEPQGVVKAFIDFVLSPKGQSLVGEADFVPIG